MVNLEIGTSEIKKRILWLLAAFAMLGSHIKPFCIFFCIVFPIALKGYIEEHGIGTWPHMTELEKRFSYKKSVIFALIWMFWAVVSLLWAADKSRGLYQLEFFVLAIACGFVLFYSITSTRDLIQEIRVIGIVALINNVLGWYEIITKNYLFVDNPVKVELYQTTGMPVALFDNTNDFATYLSFMIFFVMICFCVETRWRKKLYYLLLMISSVVLIFEAGSKANMIGLLLGFGLLFFYGMKSRKMKIMYLVSLGLGIIFILINIGSIGMIFDYLKSIFTHTYRAPGSSYSIRINIILNSFIALWDTLGVGVGIGNSQFYMQNCATFETYGTYALHNFWLEIFVDYGIIIGILFFVFYFKLFLELWKSARKSNKSERGYISLGFACCLIVFTFGSLSSSSNMTSIWLWIIFALIITYQRVIDCEGR